MFNRLMFSMIQQQDTSFMQQQIPSSYGSIFYYEKKNKMYVVFSSAYAAPTVLSKTLPTQSYGQGYGAMPQFDQQQQQQQQIPVPMATQAGEI
jgi:hypothetical protein